MSARAAVLVWTAPGDDEAEGQAATYDLRRAAGSAAEFRWDEAGQIVARSSPRSAGIRESLTVADLDPAVR